MPFLDPPRLIGLATATPPYVMNQDDVRSFAKVVFPDHASAIERLMPVYENAGIETRHSAVPLQWFAEGHGWRDRHDIFVDCAVDLCEAAARQALDEAGMAIDEIDAVVAVSTTGVPTPSLDALLMERMDLRHDVVRLPLFGLGCCGGVLGLARAADLAALRPGCRVLMVVVELCGLTFRRDDYSKSNIIATALFGDGAAAAVLTTGRDGLAIEHGGQYTWPDSLDVMGWRIEDDGFGVLFSRDIPALIDADFGAALDDYLGRTGLARSDFAGYVMHPGGAKVLAALERVLGQPAGSMVEAREVLRRYGNMSAATVFFVLERMRPRLDGRYLMSALGPGFTAGFLTISR